MNRLFVITLLIAVSGGTLAAQTPSPEFEVASIRAWSQSGPPNSAAGGIRIDGAQFHYSGVTLKDAISTAFNVRIFQVQAPDWAGIDRWDFAATLPSGVPRARVGDMFQKLVVDRFQLRYHRDRKEFAVYALIVDKQGLKVKPLAPDSEPATADTPVNVGFGGSERGVALNFGQGSMLTLGDNKLDVKKVSMGRLAASLERFVDRPVVDETGVAGEYTLTLELTPEDYNATLIRSALNAGVVLPPQAMRALDYGSMASLTAGLAKAGLKLEARRAALEVIVIDEARKTPTEN